MHPHSAGHRRRSRELRTVLLLLVCLAFTPALFAETVDFTLPDLEGKERRLSEFRGKWVLVNYWATWCPPCLEELPELEVFHNEHQHRDAVVIGVNMEDITLDRLQAFVESQFISFPILREKPGFRTELGSVPGLPTSYLVSPEGELVARQVGVVDSGMIERYINKFQNKTDKASSSRTSAGHVSKGLKE